MKPIFIADDYGLAPTIDRAIIELARGDALDGASVLVTTADLQHVAVLRELPELRVGLHLCLTWGHCASAPRQLGDLVAEDGAFGGLDRLARLWLTGRLDVSALRSEIAAQVERLRAAAGRVDFVDGHQHVHLMPPVERALEEVIATQSAPLRVRFGTLRSGRKRHRVVLNALTALRRARGGALPFSSTERMVDYDAFDERAVHERSTEVMLHVAHPDLPDPSLDLTSYPFLQRVAQFERRARAGAAR